MVSGGGGRERGMLRWHADGWAKTRIVSGLVWAAILLRWVLFGWLVDRGDRMELCSTLLHIAQGKSALSAATPVQTRLER
jgi:hypothetical protein